MPKAFSLRRRWAALAARMRCRLRSSRYHYYIKTTPLLRLHLISQLSLTASPPRGSLLVGRIFRQLPITASNFFTQQMPAGQQTAQLDARAGEARPKGKYSRERMALAPIRARGIFPATGHARSQLFRLPTSFNQLSRHNAAFFGTFLGSKKVPSSSFPLFPSSFRPILHKKALSLIACLSHFESALFHPCFFSQALTCRKSTWGYSAIARS